MKHWIQIQISKQRYLLFYKLRAMANYKELLRPYKYKLELVMQ